MAAKARGVKFGPRPKLTEHQRNIALQRLVHGDSGRKICQGYWYGTYNHLKVTVVHRRPDYDSRRSMEEIWNLEVGKKLSKGLETYPVLYSISYLLFFILTLATFFGFLSYCVLVVFFDTLGVFGAPVIIWVIAVFMSLVWLGINSFYLFTFPAFLKEVYGRYISMGNRVLYFSILYFESIILFGLIYATLENVVGGQFNNSYDFVTIYFNDLADLDERLSEIGNPADIIGARVMASFLAGLESFFQAIYFSVITQTTIGYGDTVPVGGGAKFFAILQAISTFIIVVFLIGRTENQPAEKHVPFTPKAPVRKNLRLKCRTKK
ncbi:MAG: potassium channel family protein [Paracoccaceae bacterium]